MKFYLSEQINMLIDWNWLNGDIVKCFPTYINGNILAVNFRQKISHSRESSLTWQLTINRRYSVSMTDDVEFQQGRSFRNLASWFFDHGPFIYFRNTCDQTRSLQPGSTQGFSKYDFGSRSLFDVIFRSIYWRPIFNPNSSWLIILTEVNNRSEISHRVGKKTINSHLIVIKSPRYLIVDSPNAAHNTDSIPGSSLIITTGWAYKIPAPR